MTDSTDNALPPCPFCGGGASFKPRSFKASCDDCGAYVPCGATSSDEAIAAWSRRADLAPDPLGAVKVKPLVWDGFRAGPYWIEVETGGLAHLFCDYDRNDEGVEAMKGGFLTLVSIDDLKAAAQADYERRIRSALEPCDPLDDARVKALVDALIAMLDHSGVADAGPDMKDPEDHAAERQARAALAAFDKGGSDE